ncbi:unnamed protein product [Prunus brigantina]
MVVMPHFMDIDWKLHKRIFNFGKITSHKGIDMGKTICACMKAWGIEKVFSVTVDNSYANDEAVVYVGNRLKDFNDLLLDGKYLHLRMVTENQTFQAYFEEIKKDEMKRVGPPSNEDWEKSIFFVHFLMKFYYTTLKLSATKMVTSNLIFHGLIGFQNLKANSNKKDEVVREVRTCLFNLYHEYRGVDALVSQPMNEGQDENFANEVEGYDDVQIKMFPLLVQQRKEEKLVETSNEVDKYFINPFESPFSKGFKLLNWWKGNEGRYPILSKISNDIFAIPSSTVASENAFSLGKRLVDPFRASLKPKMVGTLVCTSDWLMAYEFCFYKEPIDEELAFSKELEALEKIET